MLQGAKGGLPPPQRAPAPVAAIISQSRTTSSPNSELSSRSTLPGSRGDASAPAASFFLPSLSSSADSRRFRGEPSVPAVAAVAGVAGEAGAASSIYLAGPSLLVLLFLRFGHQISSTSSFGVCSSLAFVPSSSEAASFGSSILLSWRAFH